VEKKVALYSGRGGELFFDLELALKRLKIPYAKIKEREIWEDKLSSYSSLIFPGGVTVILVSSLSERGLKKIRNFVHSGGGYLGICAGAYIAPSLVEVPGRPEGLGIINLQNKRERGSGLKLIRISCQHPVTKGYQGEVKIYYQNGPLIVPGKDVEVLARYKEEGDYAAIVASRYGQGKVVIFSPHPEGSKEGRIDPEEVGTILLLKNALEFICRS